MGSVTKLMRLKFRRPTECYHEALAPLDEEICALVAKRKEVSSDNPGFPDLEKIAAWCERYGLNEDLMRSIFAALYNENRFLPIPEPTGFRKFVPILKSVVLDDILYAATHMKQYENASVVYIETEIASEKTDVRLERAQIELSIAPQYQCRADGGYGSQKGMRQTFVVTPPLPDDTTSLEFSLKIKPHPVPEELQALALKEMEVTIK